MTKCEIFSVVFFSTVSDQDGKKKKTAITPMSNSKSVLQEPQNSQSMKDGGFYLQLHIVLYEKANLHPDCSSVKWQESVESQLLCNKNGFKEQEAAIKKCLTK